MAPRYRDSAHGVLIVDKPAGMTSHDVVQLLRRAARTARVGHAGTLDPLATGVLVVMLGDATKLAPYLSAAQKCYEGRVALGVATDTLDAGGRIVKSEPLPAWWGTAEAAARIDAALAAERARVAQIPPAFSAIRQGGIRAHARARRGEDVELAPRPVTVHALALAGMSSAGSPESSGDEKKLADTYDRLSHANEAACLQLELRVSKGYYVRALARDLGETLGCPAHLGSLRRTASGPFAIEEARPLAALLRDTAQALIEAIIPLGRAAGRALPVAVLAPRGILRARHGNMLCRDDFEAPPPAGAGDCAWLDAAGELVAIGRILLDNYRIIRGFS